LREKKRQKQRYYTKRKIRHHAQTIENEHIELWYARELMTLLGYTRWEKIEITINRANENYKTTKIMPADQIRNLTKMISLGSDANRPIKDYTLKIRLLTNRAK
jgi:DNA-damage-inducible protein D